MVGVRPCERSPVSILYKTNPCASAMPTKAPVKTKRLSIIGDSKIEKPCFHVALREWRFRKSHGLVALIERATAIAQGIDFGSDIVILRSNDAA